MLLRIQRLAPGLSRDPVWRNTHVKPPQDDPLTVEDVEQLGQPVEQQRIGLRARHVDRHRDAQLNRSVDLEELCEFLATADIYVTSYLAAEQIVSGTLAYALGSGKSVVSTPDSYAQKMLGEGRGRLVPFRDPAALAREIGWLLDNKVEGRAMRKNAYP